MNVKRIARQTLGAYGNAIERLVGGDIGDVRFNTWVDAVGNAVTTATEYGRNFAFKDGTKVLYQSKYYSALKNIRFKATAGRFVSTFAA